MPQSATAPVKKIVYEGVTHEFPADFSDKDIQDALSSLDEPKAAATDAPPPTALPAPPDSVLGGFGRRAVQTAKGVYHTFADPPQSTDEKVVSATGMPLPAYRMLKGAGKSEVEAGKQTVKQSQDAARDARAGDFKGTAGDVARATTTAVSMADPFATGTVTDVNRLQDEGRTREAIGTAAFDGLTLLMGSRIGRAPSETTKVANLTGATGTSSGAGVAEHWKAVLPDIEETARIDGKPQTVGDLKNNVQATLTRMESKFNGALFPIRMQQIMPSGIESRLRALITPDMTMTPAGKAARRQILKATIDYQKPWRLDQLNSARMREGANLSSFYDKDPNKAASTLKSDTDVAISKAVRDGAAEDLYNAIDKRNPGFGARELKMKQSHLLELNDRLANRVKDLEDTQAAAKSQLMGEKARPHGYLSPKRAGVYMGLKPPEASVGGIANVKVGRAFAPTNAAVTRRAAVLALPVGHVAQKGLPPPPKPTQSEPTQ
jgi:hypothetical protein